MGPVPSESGVYKGTLFCDHKSQQPEGIANQYIQKAHDPQVLDHTKIPTRHYESTYRTRTVYQAREFTQPSESPQTMSFQPLNPRPMLASLINETVSIRLKWNAEEYRGRLVSVDAYMNIQLAETVEFAGGKESSLGTVLIRCNNVLWIADASAKEDEDREMGGT
ncbi:MAG: hypothetical protein Q9159_000757 [Coniocarpon cinnabarinum]